MKVACGIETGEALAFRQAQGVPSRSRDAWQGATRENSGPTRLRSNAARRDASPVECKRDFHHGLLGQSGFEPYVPRTRVVLFEAGLAAAHGLEFEEALATITIDAAKILSIDDRVGSLEVGKDADLALFDGDPFEYTSHCIGVVTDGVVVSEQAR